MDKKGFKIGDKVKLKCPQEWGVSNEGVVGKIIAFDRYVRVSWGRCPPGTYYPHLPDEIYKINVKGQQLKFSFMGGC